MLTNFFDFYLANLVYDFSTQDHVIYFSNKLNRIRETKEQIVERFYNQVRVNLHYAVLREFRHAPFNYNAYTTQSSDIKKHKILTYRNHLDKIERHVNKLERNNNYDWRTRFRIPTDVEINKIIKLPINLKDVYDVFDDQDNWDREYGGKLWAKGTFFLLNLPKTDKDKIIWIDRVLDLYHNSGPLLNKTQFKNLFKPKQCGIGRNKRNALNYRRYANADQLARYASKRVSNIFNANRRCLPVAI